MFDKYYISKMQVCLYLKDSIKLVELFGVYYFTKINVRNTNLDIIQKKYSAVPYH